jgi:mRNA-degrading endonuclease RelE of RelBE toxin-antitoxin system
MPDKIIKFIQSLDARTRERILKKTEEIKEQTRVRGSKKLKGQKEHRFRVRVGNIRIIYCVRDGRVEVVDIDWRGNIY